MTTQPRAAGGAAPLATKIERQERLLSRTPSSPAAGRHARELHLTHRNRETCGSGTRPRPASDLPTDSFGGWA